MKNLTIFPLEAGPVATFGYLLCDTDSKTACVIDVPYDSAEAFAAEAQKQGCDITTILLTHSHWDHTADIGKLRSIVRADVYVHQADEYRMIEPMKHTLWQLPFEIQPVNDSKFLEHHQVMELCGWNFEVVHTPGHTEGGVCFLDKEKKIGFVGDTLFAGSVGRTDLPGGNFEELRNSIQRELLILPDEFVVFPGHGPHTTIGQERRTNPFLQPNFQY